MKRIDKMLYEAKLLDVQTREYKPCYVIGITEAGDWAVSGCKRRFSSEAQAVDFCKEQAAGRRVGIVVCDIPRVLPQGDFLDTCATSEADAMKELIEYGAKGTI